MATTETLACWNQTTQDEQNYLLYVAVGGTAVSLACFVAAPTSEQTWLIYQQLGGAVAGGTMITVVAPANLTDFSMFPGGIAPAAGKYIAFDDNWIYTFDASIDTTWQQSARSN